MLERGIWTELERRLGGWRRAGPGIRDGARGFSILASRTINKGPKETYKHKVDATNAISLALKRCPQKGADVFEMIAWLQLRLEKKYSHYHLILAGTLLLK